MNFNNHLRTLVSLAAIPGAIAYSASYGSANALSVQDLNFDGIQQLKQVLSQNSEPPEVIINEPGTGTGTGTRNEDTRFTCELVNGEYTVMYYPESQPNEGYPWAICLQCRTLSLSFCLL